MEHEIQFAVFICLSYILSNWLLKKSYQQKNAIFVIRFLLLLVSDSFIFLWVILVFVFDCFSTNLNAKIKGNSKFTLHNFERNLLYLILLEFRLFIRSLVVGIRYLKWTHLIENPFFKPWTLLYGVHSWPSVVLGSLGSVNKVFSGEIVAPFGETSQPHLENPGIRNCLQGVRKDEKKKGRLIAGQHLTVASSCLLHPPLLLKLPDPFPD